MGKIKKCNIDSQENGITLLALVITIIVLLILAAISISMLTGDNGIIGKSKESKEETIKAREREYIQLAYQKLEIEKATDNINITEDKFAAELRKYDENTIVNTLKEYEIGNDEIIVKKEYATDYAEVTYQETGHKYIVSFEIDTTSERYTITYNANGGNGGPKAQEKIEGEDLIITSEIPMRKWYTFLGWAEAPNETTAQYKSGDKYTKEQDTTLYAVWNPNWKEEDAVAQIGNTKYITIQEAIETCSKEAGNTQTTIIMLKNTEEEFYTYKGQNIILDLKNFTVTSNSTGALCTNNGKLDILNGTLWNNKDTTILNNEEITIGNVNDDINNEVPTIYGYNIGIDNNGILNFYDGKVQGIAPIKGDVTKTPDQYGLISTKIEENITTLQLGIVNIYEARIGWVYYTTVQEAVNKAKLQDTVTIIKDIQLKEILNVTEDKNITLDLYGHVLSVITEKNTVINNNGKLVIEDSSEEKQGTVKINARYIKACINNEDNGNLELRGGNIYSKGNRCNSYAIYNMGAGSVIISGAQILSESDDCDSYGVYNKNIGTVQMLNGTIECNADIFDWSYGIYNENNGNVKENGGTIKCSAKNPCGIYNNIGNLNITGGNINCNGTNGGLTYGIFNGGSNNINITGGEINCDGASTSDTYGIFNKSNGNIDIKNVIIFSNARYSSDGYGIYNKGDGNITIENGSINGIHTDIRGYGIYNENLGKIIIEHGEINGSGYGIYNQSNGTISIGSAEEQIINQDDLIIKGVNANNKKGYGIYNINGNIEFFNGKIQGKQAALLGIITKSKKGYTAENAIIGQLDTLYLVEKMKEYVVQVGDIKFYSLQEALENIHTDDKIMITVIKDFEICDEILEFNKNISLDLNGFTITNKYYKMVNTNKLEIVDSSQEQTGKIECINTVRGVVNSKDGNLKITGGTISCESKIGVSCAIYNESTSDVTIEGGTICGISTTTSYGIYNENTGKVIFKDGNIRSYSGQDAEWSGSCYSYGIYNFSTGSVEISGGTLNSNCVKTLYQHNYGIYNGNEGYVSITAGIICSTNDSTSKYNKGYGIYNSNGGNIKISGGEIKCISKTAGDGINNNGIAIITGGNIYCGAKSGTAIFNSDKGETIIGIMDSVISKENPMIKSEYIGTEIASATYGIYNTGGTLKFFDGKIEGSTKAVYDIITQKEKNTELDYNEDETVLILAEGILPVAQIGEKKYISLQEAIDSTDNEQETTIEILKNINYTAEENIINVSNTKNIIIDLKGYKISSAMNSEIIQNEGKLQIQDTSENKSGKITCNAEMTINNTVGGILSIKGGTIENRKKYVIFNSGTILLYEGYVACNCDEVGYGIYNESAGNIEMFNGNINCNAYDCYGIYNIDGTIKIHDGTINSNAEMNRFSRGIYSKNGGRIEVSGGKIRVNSNGNGIAGNCDIIMTGGSVNGSGTGVGISNWNGTTILGTKGDGIISKDEPYVINSIYGKLYYYDGKISGRGQAINQLVEIEDSSEMNVLNDNGQESITLEKIYTNVASVNGVEYDSIQKSISACGDTESTIKILRDSNPGNVIIIDETQKITIDLNGHTINNYIKMQNKGSLKIIDTSKEQTGKIVGLIGTAVANSGTMELKSGTIADSKYGINNSGILNITGGKIENNTYGIYNSKTTNIEKGIIILNTYGVYNYSNSIKIDGGELYSNEYGVYNYNGSVNVTCKAINSNTYGVYVAGGTANISEEAEISSSIGIYASKGTTNIGTKGTMNLNTPIIIGETYGITILDTAKVYMYDGQIKGKTAATQGFITYTEDGYIIANKEEGEYKINYLALKGTIESVAQVNGINYSNLQSAINSVTGTNVQTIKLMNGIDTDATFSIIKGQNIILDMNNKTISSSANITIENAGNLSIIDSTASGVAKISSTTGIGILNNGTVTLGEDDGLISRDIITIEGTIYGIKNEGILNFYDGKIKGNSALKGNVTNKPENYEIKSIKEDDKEVIYLFK